MEWFGSRIQPTEELVERSEEIIQNIAQILKIVNVKTKQFSRIGAQDGDVQ